MIPPPDGEIAAERAYVELAWPNPPADRPYVALNVVTTVDGHAVVDRPSRPIGSPVDRRLMRQIRAHADALLFGAATLRAENVNPTVPADLEAARVGRGLSPQPLAVTITASGDLPLDRTFWRLEHVRRVVFAGRSLEPGTLSALRERAEVVVADDARVNLAAALRELRLQHGVRWLLCEGGPRLNGELLGAGLVDEIFWTVAPTLSLGDGPGLLSGPLLPPDLRPRLRLVSLFEQESELFLRYVLDR